MAGVDYSVASYVTHVISGLPLGYNLMRRMLTVFGTHETLNEDSLSSHIIQDGFMQEFERSTELLPQAKYVAPTEQGRQTGQRGKSGGGRGGGGKSSNTKSLEGTDRGKSAKGNDRGSSGSRRGGRRYYICGDLDHLSYDCPDHDEKQILIPDVLYIPGVQANLLSAGQLKDSEVKLQDEGDEMLLVSATGDGLEL
ncbi:unnamed protein product [Closterium sp. NIES-53]